MQTANNQAPKDLSTLKMEALQNVVFEIGNIIGSIGVRVEYLHDVEVKLGHLREDMDSAAMKGEERYYYREHHREVRMLSELMRYLLTDLNEASAKAYEYHTSLHKFAIRGEMPDEPLEKGNLASGQ